MNRAKARFLVWAFGWFFGAFAGVFEVESSFFVVLLRAFDGWLCAGLVLCVEVFEVGDAPAAACACAEAF